jgi:hypothetical protein
MTQNGKYYIFSGHAIGVAAQFHRLDDLEHLNHVVPTVAASVLPPTGGLSHDQRANYCLDVDHPRKRTLISVRRAETKAEGRTLPDRWDTEVQADIDTVRVVDKLQIGSVKLHLLSSRDAQSDRITVSTRGSSIEGLQLGRVSAKVTLDMEPMTFCGTRDQLADYYRGRPVAWRNENAHRFAADPATGEFHDLSGKVGFSLVQGIELSGTQDPEHPVSVDGYTIIWKGFGRIILGEVYVKGNDRRVTMVRLAMGSDAGGTGSVGDGGSNGQMGGN